MELFKMVGEFVFDNSRGVGAMKSTVAEGANAESKLTKAFKRIGLAIASAFAIQKIKEFGNACIEAYEVQQQAELKLQTIMRQRMGSSDSEVQQIKDLTSAQQKLGVVGDEVQLAGAQQLATFLNSEDSLKTLIPAMNNLAVQQNGCNVSSENMVSIGNMMGKVMQGNTGALTRMGITFTEAQEKVLKYGTEEERASMLAQVLQDNVGNMNEEFAKTDAGKIAQAKNTLGDLKEEIGAKLIPVQAKFYTALAKIGTYVVEKIIPAMEKTGKFISEHKGLMTALAVIIGIVTTAMGIQTAVQAVKNAMNSAEATSLGALIAMKMKDAVASMAMLPPYILLVAAIVAVIAIGVLLYKNWDKIKAKAGELKAKLIEIWNAIKEKVIPIVDAIKNGISKAWEGIKTVTLTIWNALKNYIVNPVRNAWNVLSGLINTIKSGITSGWNVVKSITSSVWNGLKSLIVNPIQTAWNIISGIVNKIKNAFNFHWSLPPLKLPHISVSGGKAPFGIAGKGSLPKFSIKWYKKAMEDPVLMNKPTAFGMNARGDVLAGGEAGQEVVSGSKKLMGMISDAVSNNNKEMIDMMKKMFEIMQDYMPKMANMQMVMDTGTLVGEIAPTMDSELGKIRRWNG